MNLCQVPAGSPRRVDFKLYPAQRRVIDGLMGHPGASALCSAVVRASVGHRDGGVKFGGGLQRRGDQLRAGSERIKLVVRR